MVNKKRIAVMTNWDFSKYGFREDFSVSTPLTFGYEKLVNEYDVTLIMHDEDSKWFKLLTRLFGDEARSIIIQLKCCKLNKKQFDLIYYPIDRHAFLLGILRKFRFVKLPILMLNHFSYNTSYISNWKKRLFVRLERSVLFHSIDKIIYAGDKVRQIAEQDYRIPAKHREDIGWGASLCYFDEGFNEKPIEDHDYYLAAGSANRDYKTLIEAFKKLPHEIKIIGNGPIEFTKYGKTTNQNIMFYNLRDHGIKGDLELRNYYCNATAVLIPVLKKNDVPNGATVLVEALAAGKPIVITDMDTNYIDVVKENVGLVVAKGDVDGWVKAIQFLEENPDKVKIMGNNARKLAESRYNYSLMGERISEIIEGMC